MRRMIEYSVLHARRFSVAFSRRFSTLALSGAVLISAALFSSCTHKELCYHHPHTANVRIDVDWSEFLKDDPTGMTVAVYPADGGRPVTRLTNTTSHALFKLPAGSYNSITFNQSESEYGSVSFRGMDRFETAEVYANVTKSTWYKTRTDGERLGSEPEWIGTDHCEGSAVTEEMVDAAREEYISSLGTKTRTRSASSEFVIATHVPENIIYTVYVTAKVKGFYNLRSARASLSGLAEGYLLGQGKVTDHEVTQLMEEWSKKVDEHDPTMGTITAKMTCFGLPGNHAAKAEENDLVLSILLVDNKTVLDFPFRVGDKFIHDHEKKELHLFMELDKVLPDVPPEGGSAGAFDATVDDWGDEEDYEIGL